jgi:hypothetical protein
VKENIASNHTGIIRHPVWADSAWMQRKPGKKKAARSNEQPLSIEREFF